MHDLKLYQVELLYYSSWASLSSEQPKSFRSTLNLNNVGHTATTIGKVCFILFFEAFIGFSVLRLFLYAHRVWMDRDCSQTG